MSYIMHMHTLLSLLYFSALVALLGFVETEAKLCDELPKVSDKMFLHANLVSLFKSPKQFYYLMNKFIRSCDLHYIDLNKVNSPEAGNALWIAYVGDSLNRELFHGAAQRFGGYMAMDEEELVQNLLPKHLGPSTEENVNAVHNTYHQQKLLCCRSNYLQPGLGHPEGSDSCIFALSKDAAAGNEEAQEKYKMYLFDSMADYIEDFVVPLYTGQW
jgi:hypothetical protein